MNKSHYVKISLPLPGPDGSIVHHTLQGEWLVGFGGISDNRDLPLLSITAGMRAEKRWGEQYWFVIRSASGKLVVYQASLSEGKGVPSVAIYDSFEAMQPHVPPNVYEFALKRAGLVPREQFTEVPLEGV